LYRGPARAARSPGLRCAHAAVAPWHGCGAAGREKIGHRPRHSFYEAFGLIAARLRGLSCSLPTHRLIVATAAAPRRKFLAGLQVQPGLRRCCLRPCSRARLAPPARPNMWPTAPAREAGGAHPPHQSHSGPPPACSRSRVVPRRPGRPGTFRSRLVRPPFWALHGSLEPRQPGGNSAANAPRRPGARAPSRFSGPRKRPAATLPAQIDGGRATVRATPPRGRDVVSNGDVHISNALRWWWCFGSGSPAPLFFS